MALRCVDLNLLVALDALLRELHVTRAADRIGLSQPAMSNAVPSSAIKRGGSRSALELAGLQLRLAGMAITTFCCCDGSWPSS